MRRLKFGWRIVGAIAFMLLPGVVSAQSTIAGVVRDTSGAVLPGVTVEAASDVLIEKTRSASSPTATVGTRSSICGPAPTTSPSR